MQLTQLQSIVDTLLQPKQVRDYCPNGLQVTAQRDIQHIITGVTASQQLIERAIAQQADLILVHHGLYWQGSDATATGVMYHRLQALFAANVALMAYHLPLDVHPIVGNNVQLAEHMGWPNPKAHSVDGIDGLLYQANLVNPTPLPLLLQTLTERLARSPLCIANNPDQSVQRIAWCTGAGQKYITQAAALGADVFISGEVSEQTTHLARELDIVYLACGHHATERYGIQRLGEYLQQTHALTVDFIDCDNPV